MAIDSTVTTGLCSVLEASVNKALEYDPASRQRLAQLTDVIAIHCTSPDITLFCCGHEHGVRIRSYFEDSVATTLSGSPLALASLLQHQTSSLANSGVTLQGKVGLVQQWQQILRTLDIDWEEALCQGLGDIAGPLVANGIRKTHQWTHTQRQESERLISDYLIEELGVIPSKTELAGFSASVSELALAGDRLIARIERLQKVVTHKTNQENSA